MTVSKAPIDVFASAPHYLDHIVPVWQALRKASRGTFYVQPDILALARLRVPEAVSIETTPVGPSQRPILVSAGGNLNHVVNRGRSNAAIMEHGCGLSYGGGTSYLDKVAADSSSYAGGLGRPAGLFLHPGEHPAARDRARYPDARVEVVGSPKLDGLPARVPDGVPTVAFAFHWDAQISPETRSAFIFYREHIANVAKEAAGKGYRVLGHGHPRIIERLAPWYERHGIEVVRDFDEVCRRADVFAVDNSSTLYEFASTGRPVIVLNAPFYRKHVDHGLRFWEAATVGVQVDEPYDLHTVVPRVLTGKDIWKPQREAALDLVYAYRDGAAARAARVLEDWARGLAR